MRFSIQSKMIVGILLISIVASSIVGYLGYRSGKDALQQSIYDRLTSIRIAKASQLESYLKFARNQAQSFSESLMVVDATKAFREAIVKIREKKLSAQEEAELRQFYEKDFMPVLDKRVDTKLVLESVYPPAGIARYLQYQYIVKNPNAVGQKNLFMDPKDGSDYAREHVKFHTAINNYKTIFGYDDVMLVDADTSEVIYSVNKEVDLGTDFDGGAFSKTGLAEAIRKLQRDRDKDAVVEVDYEIYRPSFGKPAAFMLSPIFDGMTMVGILVIQFPIDKINNVISSNNHWEESGLGKTGEIYLVGDDGYMRNESRFFVDNPKDYLKKLSERGFSKSEVEKTERINSTIHTVRLKSEAINRISRGQSGIGVFEDYLGREVLVSFAPLQLKGLKWGIVAKINTEEAFAPVRKFSHDLLTSLTAIGFASTILAALMGASFSRPVRSLIRASRHLSDGHYTTRVKVKTKDEFADLAETFNVMAAKLELQHLKIEEKIQENERLLESMLPAPVAARLRSGPGESQSDSHDDVTVLFASVIGFDAFSEKIEPAKSLSLLNKLIGSFDEAAERNGVEKLKSIGASYLAVCGLSVQRFDHSQRAVAFALEVEKILGAFNRENGSQLEVKIGIHRGPVTGGIIGRNKFIYDLWGRTVNIAKSLGESCDHGVIRVSQDIQERIAGIYNVKPSGKSSDDGELIYIIESVVS